MDTGKVKDTQYAIPMSINVKSIVFYPKAPAQAAGLAAPATFADLQTLSTKLASTGTTPWCLGIESECADRLARDGLDRDPDADRLRQPTSTTSGSTTRSRSTPRGADVLNEFDALLLTDGQTNAGGQSIASKNFDTAGNPMFDTPAEVLHVPAGHFVAIEGGFPDAVLADLDATVGVFPCRPRPLRTSRSRAAATWRASSRQGQRRRSRSSPQFLTSKDYGPMVTPTRRVDLAAHRLQPEPVPDRD